MRFDSYLARKDQLLREHLENTARLAWRFARVFGCSNIACLTAFLHDLGKYTHVFQDYLRQSLNGEKTRRGEVIHALQGAKRIHEIVENDMVSDIIGNIIASHHGGLFDTIHDGTRTLSVKIDKGEDKLHYKESLENFSQENALNVDTKELAGEISSFIEKCKAERFNHNFMLHFLTKIIFSCVVDADRCDSARLEIDETVMDWGALIGCLDAYLSSEFTNKETSIDKVRKNISEQCKLAGERDQGTYTLSVPTGGGKTLSSLRFALEHAKRHNLKRIIYVIPYLSIIDQTAKKFRDVFGEKSDELILENHSNIELPEKDDEEEKYRLLTDRWDSPIVLTTMVQFLETIYSNKASDIRKFHNMSEAVLIFDEIQALPVKCIHLFNDAINFLRFFGKSSTLLCSATQPHLHKAVHAVKLSNEPSLVRLSEEEMKPFERVYVEKHLSSMDGKQIEVLVKAQIANKKSTLAILNTKTDARKIYELCRNLPDCEKAFLTTDLCPAHRMDILEKVEKNLESGKLSLCVSTQLIEAGVDISFQCVIRANAGLDSIIQAAGRCNRNGEEPTPQAVLVIDVQEEKLTKLQEISDGKEITKRIFNENKDKNPLSKDVIDAYYDYWFLDEKQKDKMDYPVGKKETIYNLLNRNILGMAAYKSQNSVDYKGLPCAFKTAADNFSVIEKGQIGIVVPYGDAEKLVEEFKKAFGTKEKMRILKKLQKYSISVYPYILDKLKENFKNPFDIIEDTFYLLSPQCYDKDERGLLLEPDPAMFNKLADPFSEASNGKKT